MTNQMPIVRPAYAMTADERHELLAVLPVYKMTTAQTKIYLAADPSKPNTRFSARCIRAFNRR